MTMILTQPFSRLDVYAPHYSMLNVI